MATANRPKAHHKVPRFYLDGFTDPAFGTGSKAKLWVYRFGAPEPRPMKPSRVAVENHFNSVITSSGEYDPEPEEYLARMEGEVAAVWPALLNPQHNLTQDQRAKIAVFIGFLMTRTSRMRIMMDELADRVTKMAFRMMAANYDTLDPDWKKGLTKENMLAAADRERLVRFTQNQHVRNVFASVDEFGQIIFDMKWKIVHFSGDRPIITSDHPLSMFSPDVVGTHQGVGLLHRNVEVVLPLHRTCCLLMTWRGFEGHVHFSGFIEEQLNHELKADLAEQVNLQTVNWAVNEVYSPVRSEWLGHVVAEARDRKSGDE
jgi:hypothetical protein